VVITDSVGVAGWSEARDHHRRSVRGRSRRQGHFVL